MADYDECGWEVWWTGDTNLGCVWIIERRRWNGKWEFRSLKLGGL